jgi:hypothetical protein
MLKERTSDPFRRPAEIEPRDRQIYAVNPLGKFAVA